MAVPGFIKETALRRASGERPSPVKALLVAAAAGAAAAGVTYKVLRS